MNTDLIPSLHSPTPDIGNLSLEELLQLESNIREAIARKREARRAAALAEITRLAQEAELSSDVVMQHLGFSVRPRRRGGGKVAPKYRDPNQPANTWSGRGKRPRWLNAKLSAGASLDDFLITQAGDSAS